MYGRGLYTVYEKNTRTPTFRGEYGPYVYKLKVNLSGFLIFDADTCAKVKGKRVSIKDQMFELGLQQAYKKLQSSWNRIKGQLTNNFDGNVTFEDVFGSDNIGEFVEYTSSIALIVSEVVRNRVAGLVFTGYQDGNVCVIYDPSTVVVFGFADIHSSKKFRPITPGKEQIHRSATTVGDPSRYAHSNSKSRQSIMKALEQMGYKVDPKVNKYVTTQKHLDDRIIPPEGDPSVSEDAYDLYKDDWIRRAVTFIEELNLQHAVTPSINSHMRYVIAGKAVNIFLGK